LGHPQQARSYYDRAVQLLGESNSKAIELPRLRQEAAALLGIEK
jgi:hypothetical protein